MLKKLQKITIIINEGPGKLSAWNALRLAQSLALEDVQPYIFLLDDGVLVAKKNQNPPRGLEELDLALKLQELIALGAKIDVCVVCAKARGIEESELMEGTKFASMTDLAQNIKESDKVINF